MMKEENVNDELKNCTYIKALLMLLVVLYHSCVFWTGNWIEEWNVMVPSKGLSIFANWLNSFHVYAFTLISGYIFSYLRYELHHYGDFNKFFLKKVHRLILPAYFTSLVWIIPITMRLWKSGFSIARIISRYILAESPSQLWFLFMLFDCFVIAWFLNEYLINLYMGGLLSISFYCVGVLGLHFLPNVFQIFTALNFFALFELGILIRNNKRIGNNLRNVPPLMWVIADLGMFIMFTKLHLDKIGGGTATILLNIIGALMAFYVLQYISSKVKWSKYRLFQFFSKRSMTIYLFHQQVIYFTLLILNGKVNPYINVGINFLVSIVISSLIALLISRFKIGRYLVGE